MAADPQPQASVADAAAPDRQLAAPPEPAAPPTHVPLELAPFDYFPNVASNIAGLGGTAPRPELNYGFHTHYVRAAPGHCTFTAEFADLRASHGVLYLQVHMVRNGVNGHARIASMERVGLDELAAAGGRLSVRFESLRGMVYAVYARVGETDASATAVRVTLDRPGSDADDWGEIMLPTALGRDATRPAERLSSFAVATLAEPVSQIYAARQCQEPAFFHWCAQLGEPASPSPHLWEQAFVLQVLDRYGMMDGAARGLGLGRLESAVPAVLAAAGCELVLCDDADATPEEEWRGARWNRLLSQAPASADQLRALVTIRPAYIPAPAAELGQFDFLWSIGRITDFASATGATEFIQDSLERLRVGGVAAHVLALSIDDRAPAEKGDGALVLNRRDIERLCLDLISRGHSVAQLKFELGTRSRGGGLAEAAPVAFGFIVGRGAD